VGLTWEAVVKAFERCWLVTKKIIIILVVGTGPAILGFLLVQAFFGWWFAQ
jgi:hypothetical protein